MVGASLKTMMAEVGDIRTKLSMLWIFVALNYLYGDVFTLFGKITLVDWTQASLLGASILVETPIAMVVLSRVLKHRANRLANIVVGATNDAAVLVFLLVGLFAGQVLYYYIFFAVLEIAALSLIIRYAWKWPKP